MQIPETPQSVLELDLMKRLDAYAKGEASWNTDAVGETAKQACRTLHTNLTNLVNGLFAFVLDRVTAREMETFTMHDRVHGRKVAHLMWHILKPERREQLTPPEIGILVVAAHLHDLGMGLNKSERDERLRPESDLWDKLEIQENVRDAIQKLREQIGDEKTSESVKLRAEQQLFQAEEALLTQDTRERHATRERYKEILGLLSQFHQSDPTKIPDIEAALSFDGDSFRDKLVDVCMSHNEDADALVANDEKNLDRPRFPKAFPVGRCNADLHTVAAALRLADILDFDRERTPAVLFHYLLPTTLGGIENRSVLEWSKHLAISNWHVERDDIVFRGRSRSHIIHHAVVQFCSVIAEELKATHSTFSPLGEEYWPFHLPLSVKADIHEDGYRYIPYKFELDDDRVYSLLMGGAIYDNPLVAVRELVQNAVDACKLRDSLTRLYDNYEEPGKNNRIVIRYEEPTNEYAEPRLIVKDSGTGMDAYTLERYFLKVGRSYYASSDFNQFRVELRKRDLDFAPVSEFGIGFLSTFLLADHVEIETAMWEPLRGDTFKRTLKIDGPTRLIRLDESRNEGGGRFKGTRVTLFLAPKVASSGKWVPASWSSIKKYLSEVCQDLPYTLNLEHVSNDDEVRDLIAPSPMTVRIPPHLEEVALHIPVTDNEFGMEGEIVLLNPLLGEKAERMLRKKGRIILQPEESMSEHDDYLPGSAVLRGGFKIGKPTGLLVSNSLSATGGARIRLTWDQRKNKRYLLPNIARNNIGDFNQISQRLFELSLTFLLDNVDKLPKGTFFNLQQYYTRVNQCRGLQKYDAATIYKLARQDWMEHLRTRKINEDCLLAWERSEGPTLWYSFGSMGRELLDLVLPRVTRLQIRKDGDDYVVPPPKGWLSVLAESYDYIRSLADWGNFADYEKEIRDYLYFSKWGGTERLNSAYQQLFVDWNDADVASLRLTLSKLSGGAAIFNPSEALLLRRAQEVVPESKIGSLKNVLALQNINISEKA